MTFPPAVAVEHTVSEPANQIIQQQLPLGAYSKLLQNTTDNQNTLELNQDKVQ